MMLLGLSTLSNYYMVDAKTVEYIAQLARLKLSKEEKDGLEKDLSEILAYVDSLKEVDVSGVGPTSNSVLAENIFREDEVLAADDAEREAMIKQAPAKEGDHFKVKEIL